MTVQLWPHSRDALPKQFLPLVGERSTYQETLLRLQGPMFAPPIVITEPDFHFFARRRRRNRGPRGTRNESIYTPIGSVHRLANRGRILPELIEVQTGSYFGETTSPAWRTSTAGVEPQRRAVRTASIMRACVSSSR